VFYLSVQVEKKDNDFPPEIKVKKRTERFQKGIPNGSIIEIDHIVPKYAGGKHDEGNAQGMTRAEHAHKHFTEAHDPRPGENPHAEWAGTRYIVGRMNLDEFTDFLGMVEPMIPELRNDLQKKRGKPKK